MDDAVGIGILGAGWITRAHGHALHTLGHVAPLARPIRLTTLAARNADRGEAMAYDLGVERFTTEWADVAIDPRVDVVADLLGESAHREATEAALAGSHGCVDRGHGSARIGRMNRAASSTAASGGRPASSFSMASTSS